MDSLNGYLVVRFIYGTFKEWRDVDPGLVISTTFSSTVLLHYNFYTDRFRTDIQECLLPLMLKRFSTILIDTMEAMKRLCA